MFAQHLVVDRRRRLRNHLVARSNTPSLAPLVARITLKIFILNMKDLDCSKFMEAILNAGRQVGVGEAELMTGLIYTFYLNLKI